MKILLIGAGGFLGAISRYLMTQGAMTVFGNKIPYGTMIVNVLGSFIMGMVFVFAMEKTYISEQMRFFIAVGFLGAFTTYSTFSLESISLLGKGTYGLAAVYIFGNLLLSIGAALAGIIVARF